MAGVVGDLCESTMESSESEFEDPVPGARCEGK